MLDKLDHPYKPGGDKFYGRGSVNDRLHLTHFKIKEESYIPCRRETNCVCSLEALQLLPSKVSLLTSLNFDASAPKGLFSSFFFFQTFFHSTAFEVYCLHFPFTALLGFRD